MEFAGQVIRLSQIRYLSSIKDYKNILTWHEMKKTLLYMVHLLIILVWRNGFFNF